MQVAQEVIQGETGNSYLATDLIGSGAMEL